MCQSEFTVLENKVAFMQKQATVFDQLVLLFSPQEYAQRFFVERTDLAPTVAQLRSKFPNHTFVAITTAAWPDMAFTLNIMLKDTDFLEKWWKDITTGEQVFKGEALFFYPGYMSAE